MNAKIGVFALGLIVGALVTVLVFGCLHGGDEPTRLSRGVFEDHEVGVSRLPVSVELGCGKLTLDKIRPESGKYVVQLSLSPHNEWPLNGATVELGDTCLSLDGGAVNEADYRSLYRDRGGLHLERWMDPPPGTRTVTVTQDVLIVRPSALASFKFTKVRPGALPVLSGVRNAVVKLHSAKADVVKKLSGTLSESWSDGAPDYGEPCFLVHTSALLPEGFVSSQEGDSTRSYVIKDDKGRTFECLRHSTDNFPEVRVDPMYGLTSRPANTGSGKLVTVNDYYVFKPINPPPKTVTFELKGRFPPKPKDLVTITFRDLPLR